MKNKAFLLIVLTLVALTVYLFVDAPQPLPDGKTGEDRTIAVQQLLDIVAKENNAVRALYTKEIVGAGKEAGLKFSEDWREAGVEAGPLPALFLREASRSLEKNAVPLSLFLGSDFPIAASNAAQIKQTFKPEYFYAADIKRYTAMYPDYAISQACVDCHNKHPDSPKKDWQLQDVMGATTWLYPDGYVTPGELIKAVAAVREAFKTAYLAYLEKVKTFKNPPLIGEKWPRDGYYLPTLDVFMQALDARASSATLAAVIQATATPANLPTVQKQP
jgi:adenylate cyclase